MDLYIFILPMVYEYIVGLENPAPARHLPMIL